MSACIYSPKPGWQCIMPSEHPGIFHMVTDTEGEDQK